MSDTIIKKSWSDVLRLTIVWQPRSSIDVSAGLNKFFLKKGKKIRKQVSSIIFSSPIFKPFIKFSSTA